MNKREYVKHVIERIQNDLPKAVKWINLHNVKSNLETYIGCCITNPDSYNEPVFDSLVNHTNKLFDHLKNTSDKPLTAQIDKWGWSEKIIPSDQQFEVYKAIMTFIKIAGKREKHGIRNAYISFARQRKQKAMLTEKRGECFNGRPNLYQDDSYRFVVNRAAKLAKAKANRAKKKAEQ